MPHNMTSQNEELDLSKLSISGENRDEESFTLQYGPLQEDFHTVQCPFTWPEQITHDKMECISSHTNGFILGDPKDWKSFCTDLYYAYCNARLGKMDKAFEYIKLCQELLDNNANNCFFKDIIDGLDHVLKATVAHVHFLNGEAGKADEIMAKIVPVKHLSGPCHGALIAVHATVLHDLGLQPKGKLLTMMETIIKLDPDEKGSRRGVWYFMAGKLHGQLRRINYRAQIPSKEELQLLERATQHNPFAICLATLGESYREAALQTYHNKSVRLDERLIHKLNCEAQRLLRKAFEMDDKYFGTLRRCGNGLMKLPWKYQDIPLARKCLEKAIVLNPYNAPSYQALGKLEEGAFNYSAAAKYYQLSVDNGNLIAALALMRLHFKMDRCYNPLKDCDEYIKKAENERNTVKASFFVVKGEYYMFVEKNLILAAKEWEKAIELAPETDTVTKHWKLFQGKNDITQWLPGERYINVYECLKNEIKQDPPVSSNDKVFLEHILEICEKKTKLCG